MKRTYPYFGKRYGQCDGYTVFYFTSQYFGICLESTIKNSYDIVGDISHNWMEEMFQPIPSYTVTQKVQKILQPFLLDCIEVFSSNRSKKVSMTKEDLRYLTSLVNSLKPSGQPRDEFGRFVKSV